jgi:hypothetical protein
MSLLEITSSRKRMNARMMMMFICTARSLRRTIEWTLHLLQQRKDHRPGCHRGRTRFRVTKFSGVPAYNPLMERESAAIAARAARV